MIKIAKKIYKYLLKIPLIGIVFKKIVTLSKKTLLILFGYIDRINTKYSFKKHLKDKLTSTEIKTVYNYYLLKQKSNIKSAYWFKKDILAFEDGNYLTIPIMDLRLPKIIKKLSSYDVEKLALDKQDIDSCSKSDLKAYCDRRIRKQIEYRSKKFKSRKKTFSTNLAIKAYKDAKEILDFKKINFFLVSGTLLGAIRNGTFMENDYDIDLGVFKDEISTDELKEIFAISEKFSKILTCNEYVFEIKHKNGVVVEFFSHFLDKNAICHRTQIHKWYNAPFALTEIDFVGVKANIPQNYNLYLSENYGNWKDKVSFYDFSFDTPNVKYDASFESLEYFSKRLIKATRKGWRRTYYCSNRALKQAFGLDYSKYYPTPTDGDVMDNLEKREQLLVVNSDNIKDMTSFLVKIIDIIEGTNIIFDVVLVKNKVWNIELLKEFSFIADVLELDSCEKIEELDLYSYDKIIEYGLVGCNILKNYPNQQIMI